MTADITIRNLIETFILFISRRNVQTLGHIGQIVLCEKRCNHKTVHPRWFRNLVLIFFATLSNFGTLETCFYYDDSLERDLSLRIKFVC